MIIMYTDPKTRIVCLMFSIPKENVERDLRRQLTVQEYEDLVWQGVPESAIYPTEVTSEDLPATTKYSDAWYQNPDNHKEILYDFEKVRKIALTDLRRERYPILTKYDSHLLRAQEIGTEQEVYQIKVVKQELRDATEPLKALTDITSIDQIEAAMFDLSFYNLDNFEGEGSGGI